MKQKNDKRIFIKFIVMVIVSLIVGGVFGFLMGMNDASFAAIFKNVTTWLQINSVLLIALSYIFAVLAFAYYLKGKRYTIAAQDDNEYAFEKADLCLENALNLTSNGLILCFVFFGFLASNLVNYANGESVNFVNLLLGVFLYILSLVVYTFLQYIIVGQTKKLYPEKNGNVLDSKFRKDWYASCDEAERQLIGKAAYASFTALSTAMPFIFVVCIILNLALDLGVIPYILIGAIWFIQSQAYFSAAKTDKKSSK